MDITIALGSFAALVVAWTLTARRRPALRLIDEAEQEIA
jgi:hypothetical protein